MDKKPSAANIKRSHELKKVLENEKHKSQDFGLGDWINPEIKFLNELSLTNGGS